MSAIDDLGVRSRVIHALLAREAKKRFGNNLFGLFGAFFEPLVQVAFFGLIFYATDREGPHGANVLAFMVTGVMPFHLFSKIFTRSMGALDANKTLLSYPIMKPVDTVLARGYLEFLIYVSTYIILMEACLLFELIDSIPRIEYVLLGLVLASVMGVGAGIFTASLLSIYRVTKTVVPVVNRLCFLTSGVFFSVSMLPQFGREIIIWNPLVHVSELVRYGTFQNFPGWYFDVAYASGWAVLLLTAGVVALRYVERSPKARVRGG